MPIYEYRCRDCGHRFERIRPMGDDGSDLDCPECGKQANAHVEDAVEAWLAEQQAANSDFCYGVTSEGESADSVKWYGWKTDVARLSKQFPTVLFTLRGDGEDNEDMWVAYFLGGKCQYEKAQIAFPPFDAETLEEV